MIPGIAKNPQIETRMVQKMRSHSAEAFSLHASLHARLCRTVRWYNAPRDNGQKCFLRRKSTSAGVGQRGAFLAMKYSPETNSAIDVEELAHVRAHKDRPPAPPQFAPRLRNEEYFKSDRQFKRIYVQKRHGSLWRE